MHVAAQHAVAAGNKGTHHYSARNSGKASFLVTNQAVAEVLDTHLVGSLARFVSAFLSLLLTTLQYTHRCSLILRNMSCREGNMQFRLLLHRQAHKNVGIRLLS